MNPAADELISTLSYPAPLENSLGDKHRSLLYSLHALAAPQKLPAYLVGGPVRDWLLGLPVRDLDFVVEGDATSLARELASSIGGRAIVHNRFGTATVITEDARVDLVTARREKYPVPGALPVVEPSTIRDDLARRDFTINAMALPLGGPAASLVDPFGGRRDLQQGLVRTIHSRSFVDDPTRLFRAVRYEQRLGFSLEPETEAQLVAAIKERRCGSVSGDRLRHELEKMFREEHPDNSLSRATELRLLSAIVTKLGQGGYVARWAASGTTLVEAGSGKDGRWLAALAYPLSPSDGEALVRRLNLPLSWASAVRDAICLRRLESHLQTRELLASDLFRLLDGLDEASIAVAAELTASPAVEENLGRYLRELRNKAATLTGKDLLDLGVPPGPPVGRVLARLHDAVLDRRVKGEEEERQWVRTLVAAEYGAPSREQCPGNGDYTGRGRPG